MAAPVIDIADAVVAALNSGTFSLDFTAQRRYIPRFKLRKNAPGESDLPDLDTLRVSVVPNQLSAVSLTRRSDDFDYMVDVAVQKRLADDEPATVDPYMALVKEIADVFRGKNLAGHESAKCVGFTNSPIYSAEFMNNSNVFTSVLTFTFRQAEAQTS